MNKDLLIEIGTEELPPKALRGLMNAFATGITLALEQSVLPFERVDACASPRRLAVIVRQLALKQDDRSEELKGPPVRIAFDDNGNATPAAIAFAKKCGVDIGDLSRLSTDKGEWLAYQKIETGKPAAELLPTIVEKALGDLPVPRRMRWGTGEREFVRPVHWIVMLHGEELIRTSIMGIETGNVSQGHRFHSEGDVVIDSPDTYLDTLEKKGFVIADFVRRRSKVCEDVEAAAAGVGGQIVDGESLYDEVAALVEWPVAIVGSFEERYLDLPREVVISTLTGHQRYFPVADANGKLMAKFITVANLESNDPDVVRDGNERVIRPRLADAAFFWDNDKRKTLHSRREAMRDVVYQKDLGSLYDKSERVAKLARWIAKKTRVEADGVERAAQLAKCDLLTGMVGEFPELQGTMGRYYAEADGETEAVAVAIGEQYLPRFAGDVLPSTRQGQILATADRIDTLAGIFTLGKKPGGSRDPFGLRRAALGIVRTLIECGLDIDLKALLAKAVETQHLDGRDKLADELYVFVTDRLKRYFLDRDKGLSVDTFESVMVRQPSSLVDFDRRLAAVQTFARLEQAQSLAAANKRIANILRKAGDPDGLRIDRKLLSESAEKTLYNALTNADEKVRPLLKNRHYAESLNALADLRDPVDRFFEDVMVMTEDDAVRDNRLALLSSLRSLFLDVADVSRLSIG